MSETETVTKKPLSEKQLAFQEKQKALWAEKKAAKEQSIQSGTQTQSDYVPSVQSQEQPYVAPSQPTIIAKVPSKQTAKYDPKKRYHFQLMKEYTSAKGRDYETGEVQDNPFPPIYFIEPSGTAINPESGEIEHWRYLAGYGSIWVKDQMKPEPSEAQLSNPKNFIEFRNGSLFVSGMNTALLDAIMVQDVFEEVKNPLNPVPPVYRLVNPEKEMKQTMNRSDMLFAASKAAREASVEEMLPVAMHFGINVDKPEEDLGRIRNEFILRAENDPDNFNKQFTNPKNAFKYNITLALRDNLISTNIIPGKMVMTSTQRVYFDIKEGDSAEQFSQLVYNRVDNAVALYQQICNLLGK